MPDRPTFRAVGESDEPLYGPRKLVLLGYGSEEQATVGRMLAGLGLRDVPVVFVTAADRFKTLGELFDLERGPAEGVDPTSPRAFVMAGVTERELHIIMEAHRDAGLPRPLWATLTPISEAWTLRRLVSELAAERAQMELGVPIASGEGAQPPKRSKPPGPSRQRKGPRRKKKKE